MKSKTPFKFNRMTFDDQQAFIRSGRRCATAIPNDVQLDRVASELRAYRRAVTREVESATINVQFIHITDGDQGKITEQQRVDQIQVLNDAYNEHGIKFVYDPPTVMEVDKPEWFHMGHRSQAERAAKTALHVDPERNLNFYTAALQGGLLGWATFPFDLATRRWTGSSCCTRRSRAGRPRLTTSATPPPTRSGVRVAPQVGLELSKRWLTTALPY